MCVPRVACPVWCGQGGTRGAATAAGSGHAGEASLWGFLRVEKSCCLSGALACALLACFRSAILQTLSVPGRPGRLSIRWLPHPCTASAALLRTATAALLCAAPAAAAAGLRGRLCTCFQPRTAPAAALLQGGLARREVSDIVTGLQLAAELLPLPEDRLLTFVEGAQVGAGRGCC